MIRKVMVVGGAVVIVALISACSAATVSAPVTVTATPVTQVTTQTATAVVTETVIPAPPSPPTPKPTKASAPPESTPQAPQPTVTVTRDPGFGLVRGELCSQQDFFTISEGSDNTQAVRLLQAALASLNYDVGPIDGDFGPVTTSAVMRYQSNHGLVVDGLVGDQTWTSLRSGLCD